MGEELNPSEIPTPNVAQRATDLEEALRDLIGLTLPGASLPAPVVYEVLGNLAGIESMGPQILQQLARGLGESLEMHDVYEDDGRDPLQSIAQAADHLIRAAQLAGQLGAELAHAQQAIAGQGYRQEKP